MTLKLFMVLLLHNVAEQPIYDLYSSANHSILCRCEGLLLLAINQSIMQQCNFDPDYIPPTAML